jgi:hypothetical protein
MFKNQGFVSVGISGDTAVFAVESIRKWWYTQGKKSYGRAGEIVITADCGGSNGYRNKLWKYELQKLANRVGGYPLTEQPSSHTTVRTDPYTGFNGRR